MTAASSGIGGEHEAQSEAARRRLGPADEVGAGEATEIADRVDRGDPGRGLAALEKLGRQGKERRLSIFLTFPEVMLRNSAQATDTGIYARRDTSFHARLRSVGLRWFS